MESRTNAFPKSQRLCSRYLIDRLFEPGKSRSLSAYPVRLVYRIDKGDETQLLISVPKRCFKHAVDRNRVKRQVREAYRRNRELLQLPEGRVAQLAMIWLDGQHHPTDVVEAKVKNLLVRASENLRAVYSDASNVNKAD